MLPTPMSRRRFLTALGSSAGLIAVGGTLTGCSDDLEIATPTGQSPAADVGPTSDAVGYDRLVLHAGPDGQIERDWFGHHDLSFVRPDGQVLSHGDGIDPAVVNAAHDAVQAPDGTFWVSDLGNGRVLHLGPDFRVIGDLSTVDGRSLGRPRGIAMVDGRLAVADSRSGQIAITDETGAGTWIGIPVEQHPQLGAENFAWGTDDLGVLDHPAALQATADGRLIVFDAAASRLTVFDRDGTPQRVIELAGHPTGFAADPAGTLYVADTVRRTVYRLGDDGSETPVKVVDPTGTVELSDAYAATWQPSRLTWRDGADSTNGLVVSLLPPITG